MDHRRPRTRVAALRTATTGMVEGSTREDRAEQDLLGGPGRGALGRVEVEEECGQTGGRPQHDAGRQVAAPYPLDADRVPSHLHPIDPAADEPDQRAEAEVVGGRPTGGGDVGQRVAGEGLAPDDGEDPDDGRDDGGDGADERRPCAPARSRRTRVRRGRARRLRRWSASGGPGCRGPPGPGSATTSTRPWSLRTSTWWP